MAVQILPKLAELWNQHCGSLKKVKRLQPGGSIWEKAERFWEENPDEEGWIEAIKALASCGWCNGKKPLVGSPNWRATFIYLLRLETFDKAQCGFYDEKDGFRFTLDSDVDGPDAA